MTRIYLSPPEVTGDDRAQLIAAVDSNWVAPVGPDLTAFEADLAAAGGREHTVALSSGTGALHLALKELGVGRGDRVIVSTLTFAASANAVAYLDAEPVFVDSDASTWNLSPELVADEIEASAAEGRPIKAVVVVDLYGQCADYSELEPLLESHGVVLVEDAAEALGATYRDRPAGAFGGAAIFSFNGNKIITSGGGGALVCDDERLANRVRHLATQAREPAPHYEHVEIGYNYRMSNLLAAFGRGQLADLDRRVARRREINQRYRDGLADLPGIDFMPEADYGTCTFWLTCCMFDPSTAQATPDQIRLRLEEDDIEARPVWKPMHMQPVFANARSRLNGVSQRLFETGLCLPSGSSLSASDQDRIIGIVREVAES